MKKHIKVTALLFTLAILANMTGCEKSESSPRVSDNENSVSANESTVNGGDSSDSSGVSDNSESTPDSVPESSSSTPKSSQSSSSTPKHEFTDEELEIIKKYGILNFVAPDGETVQVTDADEIFDTREDHEEIGSPGFKFDQKSSNYNVLRYDFAYMRYRRPFFYEGEILDDDVERKMIDDLPEIEWFKVKADDKLDCGLTVKKAVFERFPVDSFEPIRDNYIEFDGEVTLEGLLFTVKNENDYLVRMNDLTFTPDPTKTNGIPEAARQFEPDYDIGRWMYSPEDYVLTDGGATWVVGTVDDIDKDEIFGDDIVARVKVTLTNIKYGGIVSVDLPAFYAEIVDIERID